MMIRAMNWCQLDDFLNLKAIMLTCSSHGEWAQRRTTPDTCKQKVSKEAKRIRKQKNKRTVMDSFFGSLMKVDNQIYFHVYLNKNVL